MERVNQLLAKTLIATALLGAILAPALAQEPPRIKGADLFVDLQQYVGKQVILTDAKVWSASNTGAFIYAGAVTSG